MNRSFLKPGLDPTLGEFFVFLAWLVVVIVSMTAMYLVPEFNLFFWPTLWIYDLWQETRPHEEPPFDSIHRLKPLGHWKSLWDRELDG